MNKRDRIALCIAFVGACIVVIGAFLTANFAAQQQIVDDQPQVGENIAFALPSPCIPNSCISKPDVSSEYPAANPIPPLPPVADTIVEPEFAPPDQFRCDDPEVINDTDYFENTNIFTGIGDCWSSIVFSANAVFDGISDSNLICVPKRDSRPNEYYCFRVTATE